MQPGRRHQLHVPRGRRWGITAGIRLEPSTTGDTQPVAGREVPWKMFWMIRSRSIAIDRPLRRSGWKPRVDPIRW